MKLFHDSNGIILAVYCIIATPSIFHPFAECTLVEGQDHEKYHHHEQQQQQQHEGVVDHHENPDDIADAVSKSKAAPIHNRVKRTSMKGTNRFYPYGIVPYTFRRGVSQTQRRIVRRVMEHYHNLTCIRFVPRISRDGQWAKDLYNLGHGGYVEFVQYATCFGGLGNNGRKTSVSCCGQDKCLHEIGHALGMLHEHQNPGRDGFLRINYDRIPQAEKRRYTVSIPNNIVPGYPFDISSPMGYDYERSFAAPITLLTPDISTEVKDFYMFQEISENHRCQENNCSSLEMRCVNDGYVTMIQAACACRCPEGLNPETGCETVLSDDRMRHKCGGVFELNLQNPTETFAKLANQPYECSWLINAPEGDTIVLDFDDFNVAKRSGECEDQVEIRHSKIGQGGKSFCGTTAPRLIRSYYNRIMVTFSPSRRRRPASSFNVTARLVPSNSLCYKSEDRGFTYAGTVNYARDYTPCMEWWRAAHCPHNPYNFRDMSSRLDGNFCRNPGNGLAPWCYVDALTCQRKYCDVCNVDIPFNKYPVRYCSNLNGMYNYCVYDREGSRKTCAKTCRSDLFPPQPKASSVTCQRPPSMLDSEQVDKLDRTQFSVGESVTFKCRHENRLLQTELKKFCLTNGNWSFGNTACLPCHKEKGYVLFQESCYKVLIQRKIANVHQRRCEAMGGQLANVRSAEEQEFITNLGFQVGAVNMYIGANDMYHERTFRFRDFSNVTWSPWDVTSSNSRAKDCVWSSSNNKWVVGMCNEKRPAVCKTPFLRHQLRGGPHCRDSRDDCANLLLADDDMCHHGNGTFALNQCTLTCGRCF